ncbi:cation-translocating P-type ATPase [Persicimonas caeni]|uniref:Cation-translocating P-type ATPase n=1 Tax=Persicimonas caeni TaxID=2292766 RepID=A0A4Y6PZG3_PERCE|nr:cation-translocating P-type ATPase [Persicimonas caeni]QDG53662.1 cation-translocating P-type ATPase [Persicimonas caeni]QED34883.1 cation-translocating P-type ATPase [Persicimonas caeni]
MKCCEQPAGSIPAVDQSPSDHSAWVAIGIGAMFAANSMIVGLSINISTMEPQMRRLVELGLLGATIIVGALLAGPLLSSAWHKLRQRQLSFEFLFLSGIVGAMGVSIFSMVRGHGPIYFEVASLLLVIYAIGNEVGRASRQRGLTLARSWIDDNPTCRIVTCCGQEHELRLDEVAVGQTVRVLPGESLPVDGKVTAGVGFVQESQLTGESFAAVKRPGDTVHAGSIAMDAMFEVDVSAAHGSRLIDRIAHSVEQAWAQPSQWQRQADRLVRWFLPLVMVVTATTFLTWTLIDSWQTGLFNALAVLLVACPCAMGFAIPLAIWMTLGNFAARGLVSSGGDCVERLVEVDTVVFDKTGTLTSQDHRMVDLVVREGLDRTWLHALAGAVEETSNHPVARAFHRNPADGERPSFGVRASRSLPGLGVEATVQSRGSDQLISVRIGTDHLVPPQDEPLFDMLAKRLHAEIGARRLAVVVDGRLAAVAAVDETPHNGLDQLLTRLETLDITPVLMTGDRSTRANRLGFPEVYAEQSPEQKRARVAQMESEGRRVAFVGDGVNDAAAMASSTVSISASHGSDLAVGVADLTWHGSDPTVVAEAVDRARQAVSLVRSNLLYAASYNAIGMSAAALGLLHPVLAAVIMVASSAFVTWRTAFAMEPGEADELVSRSTETSAPSSPAGHTLQPAATSP